MQSDRLYTQKRNDIIPNTFSTVRTWFETVCSWQIACKHTFFEETILGHRFESLTWLMNALCRQADKGQYMTLGLPIFSRDNRPLLICFGVRKSGYNARDVQRVVWTGLKRSRLFVSFYYLLHRSRHTSRQIHNSVSVHSSPDRRGVRMACGGVITWGSGSDLLPDRVGLQCFILFI